jgi:hypothetical protein
VIEQQTTDRMHDAVLDEPPLGFDPDEVVTMAARRQRGRRTTGAVAVAVAALATTATVVFGAAPGGSRVGSVGVGQQADAGTECAPPAGLAEGVAAALADHIPPDIALNPEPKTEGTGGTAADGCPVGYLLLYGAGTSADGTQQWIAVGGTHRGTSLDPTDPGENMHLIHEDVMADGSARRQYNAAGQPDGVDTVSIHQTDGRTTWVTASASTLLTVDQLLAVLADSRVAF